MQTETYSFEKQLIKRNIAGKLKRYFGRTPEDATLLQLYKAVSLTVRDEIMEAWQDSNSKLFRGHGKVVFYLSLEFLMGRFLTSNLIALEKYDLYREALEEMNVSMEAVEGIEQDAGLGNGGLGRLAACFMDSLASLSLPAIGCGIRYDYGLFKQKIVDGQQIEMPDNWLEHGCSWEIERPEEQFEILFNGRVVEYYDENGNMRHRMEGCNKVLATPYDIPIMGYRSGCANTLRIWSARSPVYFDMASFGQGDYIRASAEKELAETISRVLYPNDSHNAGKSLRLRQQYFFTSATLQYMLRRHKAMGLPVQELAKYNAVQINDTHPAIGIAELMRLLVDQELMPWEQAWEICCEVFSYTNHTVMSEALEKWPCYLIENLLPRIYMILKEIDRRFRMKIAPEQGDELGIIAYDQVRMANLCMSACHKVNGVSGLHTEILRDSLFKGYVSLQPAQIINITNGVTPRRWLLQANPELARLISETLGTQDWVNNMPLIAELERYHSDTAFAERFAQIKHRNKVRLAKYIQERNGIIVDPNSIFDIQVKRLHEYKRQLLNVLHILYLYFDIVENGAEHQSQTFVFGAKASPGYVRAKQTIELINAVAQLVNHDSRCKDMLKVVFIENYGVSNAQLIIPAADISEQISLAGKEASGTGNMKFMMNGALTIGTMDGANVEMHQLLSDENIFIFGLRAHEVEGIYRLGFYNPGQIYSENAALARVVDALADGTLSPNVASMKDYLLNGDGGYADPYLCLKDFVSYAQTHEEMEKIYSDQKQWMSKAIINVARSYYFSSDRSIKEYNEKIWQLTAL